MKVLILISELFLLLLLLLHISFFALGEDPLVAVREAVRKAFLKHF